MTRPPSPIPRPPHPHETMVSLILSAGEQTLDLIARLTDALGPLRHEILIVYGDASEPAVAALDSLEDRPPTLRLLKAQPGARKGAPSQGDALRVAAEAAAGDVIIPIDAADSIAAIPALAEALRGERVAIAVASVLRPALAEWLLAAFTGIAVWNPASGFRAYAADFLERLTISSDEPALELVLAAHLQERPIAAVAMTAAAPRRMDVRLGNRLLARALRAPVMVWGLWIILMGAALAAHRGGRWEDLADVALPAAGAFAFTLAVRRVRGRTRIADAFFSLVLLNPLFYQHARPHDPELLSAGLLGLMAGAIIAMKRDNLLRYYAVAGLALLLTQVSEMFLILVPPLVVWLLGAGYVLGKSPWPSQRVRGVFIMAAGEAALFEFGLACIYAEPAMAPGPGTLFSTIVGFVEFPLLVLAILMLALGWRRGAGGRTPPYLAGMLALLVGMLAMLLNSFEEGQLARPGADQTMVVLCLVYVVMGLHGPRRLRWISPPVLLAAAVGYWVWRWG